MYEKLPYTNFHDLNLDYVLDQLSKVQNLTSEEINKVLKDNVHEILQTFTLGATYIEETKTLKLEIKESE